MGTLRRWPGASDDRRAVRGRPERVTAHPGPERALQSAAHAPAKGHQPVRVPDDDGPVAAASPRVARPPDRPRAGRGRPPVGAEAPPARPQDGARPDDDRTVVGHVICGAEGQPLETCRRVEAKGVLPEPRVVADDRRGVAADREGQPVEPEALRESRCVPCDRRTRVRPRGERGVRRPDRRSVVGEVGQDARVVSRERREDLDLRLPGGERRERDQGQ